MTGGRRSCGLPRAASSRVILSSERSNPFGWRARSFSISRAASLTSVAVMMVAPKTTPPEQDEDRWDARAGAHPDLTL
ncbi:hypothetical protein EMEDMD4_420049 [Sinorhizobium medicae]|uniref:Uncharacterized protein n=1 Tax=Sinorhizobium medicae TaxID=110321 RepID=A0A508X368_9HYPH|nr:hypothetical protein EMEDMD4_420049 [Sinorhizobium medicae]